MSITATGMEQARDQLRPSRGYKLPHSGEYAELIRRFFRSPTSLALIGASAPTRTAEAARGIAAEIGSLGARAVIVKVDQLVGVDSPPAGARCAREGALNVWLCPQPSAASVEFAQNPEGAHVESDWLSSLARDFDAVLLECPAIEISPLAVEMASFCDAAVLVVEAGRTVRQQIQDVQRTLVIRGVKLAGCVLMKRR
jgi:hypothetical protein